MGIRERAGITVDPKAEPLTRMPSVVGVPLVGGTVKKNAMRQPATHIEHACCVTGAAVYVHRHAKPRTASCTHMSHVKFWNSR